MSPDTKPDPSITHESEVQRQFVRLALPAMVEIDDMDYAVKNLSSGGVGIEGIYGEFAKGMIVPLKLRLPFTNFSFDFDLDAEVQHFDPSENTMGLRFINLKPEQVSLLNHVLKSYMAGDTVASGDLMAIVSRNNFAKIRTQKAANDPHVKKAGKILKQAPIYLLATILVLTLSAFILFNVYNALFIAKSSDAFVQTSIIPLRATADGYFKNRMDGTSITVKPQQVIGSIAPVSRASSVYAEGFNGTNIVSPCDCLLHKMVAQDGEYTVSGDILADLVPLNSTPWILAVMDPKKAERVELNQKADIKIYGSPEIYQGHVAAIESNLVPTHPLLSSINTAGKIIIRIEPDQKISIDLAERPASVTFHTR